MKRCMCLHCHAAKTLTSLSCSQNTSLDWALYHKHKAMVDLLLSHGVSFCGWT